MFRTIPEISIQVKKMTLVSDFTKRQLPHNNIWHSRKVALLTGVVTSSVFSILKAYKFWDVTLADQYNFIRVLEKRISSIFSVKV
jgi:hypothetical protein